jgi:hypothetical protein
MGMNGGGMGWVGIIVSPGNEVAGSLLEQVQKNVVGGG